MTLRPFPAHMYRVPDPGDTRIRDLEAALLVANDEAAAFRECAELLADVLDDFELLTTREWLARARAALARGRP